jgi:hypothetical protein
VRGVLLLPLFGGAFLLLALAFGLPLAGFRRR